MQPADYEQLVGDIKEALAADPHGLFGIVGHTPLTYDLLASFKAWGVDGRVMGVYDAKWQCGTGTACVPLKALTELEVDKPSVVVLASDEEKEELLAQALPHLGPASKVLLAGYGHLAFRDPCFHAVVRDALVPSLANGYPNTLVHLYQCLQNSARLGLEGVVVEVGMFKGGTTMLLSRFIEALGRMWKVIGFETFAGFPPRRHVLDLYEHPDCVFTDEAIVRQYLNGRNVEIVSGDVVTTVQRLATESVVLAFLDTDNFTPASAVLDVIQDRVVVGGAIVFDHFTGRNRFRYTIGERAAAKRLLLDRRYFNLHDTGVFFKQC